MDLDAEAIDAVLDDRVHDLASDTGYTDAEVYDAALAAAQERYDPTGGFRATGYDVLYEVEQAIAARQVTA